MKNHLSLAAFFFVVSPVVNGQTPIQTAAAKFTDSSLDPGARLGLSVAMDGDWALAGAEVATPPAGVANAGRAFFYRRTPQGWVATQSVSASDGEPGARFGHAVDIKGGVAVVGAITPGHTTAGPGKVYVFRLQGAQWVETQLLVASDGQPSDRFGSSVALSGDFLVIGAPGVSDVFDFAGAAYVFVRSAQGWQELVKLLPPPQGATPGIERLLAGRSVAMEGNTIVVGAPFGHGAAFVFRRFAAGWQQVDILQDPTPLHDDEAFGSSVAISNDTIVVGEMNQPGAFYPAAGSAWVFEESATNPGQWLAADELRASDGAVQDYFGGAVDIHGELIAVGAWGSDMNGPISGEAYLFSRQISGWTETRRLFGDPSSSQSRLGISIALEPPYVLCGADADIQAIPSPGAAYVFEIELGSDTCNGLPNSTGESGQLAVIGSDAAVDGQLTLSAYQCPRNSFGVFIIGDTGSPIPLGEGNLCIGGALARLSTALTGSSGAAVHDIEFAHPAVASRLVPGATWSFQFYYRDGAGGPVGVNLTNTVELTLQ